MASIRKHRGKWQVQIRRQGTTARTKSFVTKKDAEAWARHVEVQADRSELPRDPRLLERITLRELVIRYRDEITPQKRGHEIETMVLNAFLRHPICSRRLSDLSASDFASYRDRRLEQVQVASLRRELSRLRNMFEIARTEWYLPLKENPLDLVRLVGPVVRRERRLREGELERIIDSSKRARNIHLVPIIRFALETGLRRSEVLAARWGDVDLRNRLLRVPRAKNGHPRSIPLTQAAVAILEDVRAKVDGDGRVFPTTANALRLAWERSIRRAGVEDIHFHDLRHEAISRFFEMGLTAPEVALISGHRDMRMLFRYAHPQRQRILEQMDRRKGSRVVDGQIPR